MVRLARIILLALLLVVIALPGGGILPQGKANANPGTVDYYFGSKSTSVWTDSAYMIDNILTNYASTTGDGDTEVLDGNTCPGTDLGAIAKVELRAYGYGDADDQLQLTPVFDGSDGDLHNTVPGIGAGWGSYVDITSDINAPDWSAWSQVQTVDVKVALNDVAKGKTMYCSKVEIRVTYTPYAPLIVTTPTVTTQAVTNKGSTTATGHGTITATGGQNCSKRGVCWNTTGNPTVADNKSEQTNSFGTGIFSPPLPMTGLTPGEHYYVKAYAYNSAGYGYGDEVEFDTWEPPISDIDVGAESIDRPDGWGAGITTIDKNNPANASGTLHSVKVWALTNLTGLRVGTFYVINGDTLKCRDSANIGNVEAGAERTFTGLSIAVEEGDYIGCYIASGDIGWRERGSGIWVIEGEYIDPNDETTYFPLAPDAISLYGYGDIEEPPAPPVVPPSEILPEAIPLSAGMEHLAWCIPLVLFSVLAFWMCNGLLFILAGGSSLMMGFSWYDVYTTNWGLGISIMLIAYSIVCLGFAMQCIFWKEKRSEE